MSKLTKQVIYGAFYLAVAGAIVYGIYFLTTGLAPSCFDNRRNQGEEEIDCGGPCLPCALKDLEPIRTKAQVFGIDDNTSILVTLSNPNLNYGVQSFVYTVNFYDSAGQKIFSLTKESFIYPAEAQKFIIEPNLRINFANIVGEPEVILENFNWQPVSQFSEPKVQLRQVKTEVSNRQVTVSGILANRESFSLARAGIGVLVYQNLPGGDTQLISISKTILQNLKPFEERAFKILAPVAENLKLSDIDTVLTSEAFR